MNERFYLKDLGELISYLGGRSIQLQGKNHTPDELNFLNIRLNSLLLMQISDQLREISRKLDR